MRYLVDGRTMKKIDIMTQEEYGLCAEVLMERAAVCLANRIKKLVKKTGRDDTSILFVCGCGNNGGDGMAAARIMSDLGYNAFACVVGNINKGSELFVKQLDIAEKYDTPILFEIPDMSEFDIVVDAIFGIGLSREPEGVYAETIRAINESGAYIVAADLPSGVNADDGSVCENAVRADETVTFGFDKIGLELYPGKNYAGRIKVCDIGFPGNLKETNCFNTATFDKEDLCILPERMPDGHKNTFGRVLVIAGSKDMAGACFMSAATAYKTGCGMVQIITCEENRQILQTLLPEAIMYTFDSEKLGDGDEDTISAVRDAIDKADAIVVGPGLSGDSAARRLVKLVLSKLKVPTVIDADAIRIIADDPNLFKLAAWNENVIFTPHVGEMAELANMDKAEVKATLYGSAVGFAETSDAVLVLKDARTIVADRNRIMINTSGNCGMGTAGAGDVLTGVIAGFAARGMKPYFAAALGVYVHGLAGDMAARKCGQDAMTATDIIKCVGAVIKKNSENEQK